MADPNTTDASAKDQPAAYSVFRADGENGRPNVPHQLCFCKVQSSSVAIPDEQEAAKLRLVEAANRIKETFANNPAALNEYFENLFEVAQATFNLRGFHPEAMQEMQSRIFGSPRAKPEAPPAGHPSAYRVWLADGLEERPNIPYELYFYKDESWSTGIPPDQESARLKLDQFCSIMKQALANDKATLDLNFSKLFTVAQATFNSGGFMPEALNSLDVMKSEILRLAGARLRSAYLLRFTKAVLLAFFLILYTTAFLDVLITLGAYAGYIHTEAVAQNPEGGTSSSDQAARPQDGKGDGPGSMEAPSDQPPRPGFGLRWESNFYIMHIGLLVAFSMWGLLFASMSRGMTLTFEDLLTPEADLLAPWIRLTFYGIAIFVLGTLFEERWITVALGDKFSTASIHDNAVAAIIFGLLLGIAERLVPQKVVQYASKLVMG